MRGPASAMVYFRELRNAIKHKYGCDAIRLKTVPVREVSQGEVIWEGPVEVFALLGHASAKTCYAWGHPSEEGADILKVVTVLEVPPVNSPESAVRAAVANRLVRVNESLAVA